MANRIGHFSAVETDAHVEALDHMRRRALDNAAETYLGPRVDTVDEEWQERGLCRQTDPDTFFPEQGESVSAAKKVCGRCAVKAECLAYALGNNERFGVWGGLSEGERRRLKRAAG